MAEKVAPVLQVMKARPDEVEPYVALFAQHPNVGIETNARTEEDFLKMLSRELVALLSNWPAKLGEREALTAAWLAQALDIGCKLRGYKAEDVIESRVLYRGTLRPTDEAMVKTNAAR